ncbi:MAG: hypothetical protein J6334_04980 [Kiritimatiellae bacterium]|nr:hypothetical protein [Kiritimatiellia bacterium]
MNVMRWTVGMWGVMCATLAADVVIENPACRLVLGDDARATSLVIKATGEECLVPGAKRPFCEIRQNRPYDNEYFITYPSKPTTFPANRVTRKGDTLEFGFAGTFDIATVRVTEADTFIRLFFEGTRFRLEDYGLKRKTEIDALAFTRLPVKRREHFGAWLNVTWDETGAVALIGDSPATRIDAFPRDDGGLDLYAGCEARVQPEGVGAILIATARADFLPALEKAEIATGLPNGVAGRRDPRKAIPCIELPGICPANVETAIETAKRGGFGMIKITWQSFAQSCGHFPWKASYPNGAADLKAVTDRIRAAGLIPAFHAHYSKASTNDAYVCGGVPDRRLHAIRNLTLARPVAAADTEIFVEENPHVILVKPDPNSFRGNEIERHLVQIGDELIRYTACAGDTSPYRLTGCTRGFLNTIPAAHTLSERFRHLDVDDWPFFIRADPDTSLNAEIAARLAEIQRVGRFDFVYFDGAEDAPFPFWANIPKAQKILWDAFGADAPPMAAGAAHGNWSWHIFTRGGPLDTFPPERLRAAYTAYILRKAKENAESFTDTDFGWAGWQIPSAKTTGMQPDHFQFLAAKAFAWNAPLTVVTPFNALAKHPRTDDNLKVLKRWAEARKTQPFPAETLAAIRDPQREFWLIDDPAGESANPVLVEVKPLAAEPTRRAFTFTHRGRPYTATWNPTDSTPIAITFGARTARAE